jgi:hypothetical protein
MNPKINWSQNCKNILVNARFCEYLNNYFIRAFTYIRKSWLSGDCRGQGKMWGYFGGGTTKIPPYILSTTEIPNDPKNLETTLWD